jgi:hypothetical protein
VDRDPPFWLPRWWLTASAQSILQADDARHVAYCYINPLEHSNGGLRRSLSSGRACADSGDVAMIDIHRQKRRKQKFGYVSHG